MRLHSNLDSCWGKYSSHPLEAYVRLWSVVLRATTAFDPEAFGSELRAELLRAKLLKQRELAEVSTKS